MTQGLVRLSLQKAVSTPLLVCSLPAAAPTGDKAQADPGLRQRAHPQMAPWYPCTKCATRCPSRKRRGSTDACCCARRPAASSAASLAARSRSRSSAASLYLDKPRYPLAKSGLLPVQSARIMPDAKAPAVSRRSYPTPLAPAEAAARHKSLR